MEYVASNDKVYLRMMDKEDTPLIIKWRNAPHVVENFIYRKPLTEADHLSWIANKVEKGQVVQFVLGITETHEEIGSIYFRDIDRENECCEFGIFIGEKDALGKGYGFLGQKLSLEYAVNKMHMKTINLRVLSKNASAVHVYEKCGFKPIDGMNEITADGEKVIFMRYEA